ncbi:hypothetical protein GCK32_019831, partial [Trichostrongylus colubriformis]
MSSVLLLLIYSSGPFRLLLFVFRFPHLFCAQFSQSENLNTHLEHYIPEKYTRNTANSDQCTRWNDEIISDTTEWKPNGKVLLALDGGGIKSLVLTQILLALEKELTGEFLPRIDWIAGTSSGGITALMLCHGKSLIEAKRFFIENRFRVFCG